MRKAGPQFAHPNLPAPVERGGSLILAVVASATGWAGVIANARAPWMGHLCSGSAPHGSSEPLRAIGLLFIAQPLPALLGSSAWMVLAMVPLLLWHRLSRAHGTPYAGQRLAVCVCLLAFATVWVAAAAILMWMAMAARALVVSQLLAFAAVVGVPGVVWQLAPARRRRLEACSRSLGLLGDSRARRQALMIGVQSGGSCVSGCSVAMLLALLVPHRGHIVAMMLANVVMLIEERRLTCPSRQSLIGSIQTE